MQLAICFGEDFDLNLVQEAGHYCSVGLSSEAFALAIRKSSYLSIGGFAFATLTFYEKQ